MRIITEGREACVKFWRTSNIPDVPYRLMKFTVIEDCQEGTLLLNTVTGELILLNDTELDFLSALPAFPKDEISELISKRFLVPVDYDEVKSVNQLRALLRKFEATEEIAGYTIVPTSGCNARCFYCYESDIPHYNMTEDTAKKIVEYIRNHSDNKKKISLHWFGGEPTLGEKRIDEICCGLSEIGIAYESTMISNGYLFSEAMVRKAKEKWYLRHVQITLDGTEEVYNKTKAYVNATGSPYKQVLGNIALLLEQGIRVSVRLNLGFHNAEDLRNLIDELVNRFMGKKGFLIYVHELFENQGYTRANHSVEERLRLNQIRDDLNRYITEKGCNNGGENKSQLPCLKTFYCMADTPTSLLINPLGQLGKCEHEFFSHLVGDVDQGHDFETTDAEYWLRPKYAKDCEACALYPFCGQVESCETNSVCFSDQIRIGKINVIRTEMRQNCEGGKANEETGI